MLVEFDFRLFSCIFEMSKKSKKSSVCTCKSLSFSNVKDYIKMHNLVVKYIKFSLFLIKLMVEYYIRYNIVFGLLQENNIG